MARQTSHQVTTPELTIFLLLSHSGPRQYWLYLAIQFGYVMDRWNQLYFFMQLNIRLETINSKLISNKYQIHEMPYISSDSITLVARVPVVIPLGVLT